MSTVIGVAGGRLDSLPADAKPVLEVTSDKGKILNPVAQPNGETGGWRLSFELEPGSETQAELRAVLRRHGGRAQPVRTGSAHHHLGAEVGGEVEAHETDREHHARG